MFRMDNSRIDTTDGFEVWLDKPCVPPRLPLMYFMGHQVMPYSDMVSDQLPLFTHAKFGTAFSDIFDLNDPAVLNSAMRRRYNDLDVKPFLYVRRGAWDEEKVVPKQYPVKVEGEATFGGESIGITVSLKYWWDGELKDGFVTAYPSQGDWTMEVFTNGTELTAKTPSSPAPVYPNKLLTADIGFDPDRRVWEIMGSVEYFDTWHEGTETIIIHHPAEKKVDRELTLDRLEDICIDIGMMHHDEWLGFKNISKKYYETIDDGDIYNTIDVTKETINATDVESGSIKNEGVQTPNGWKEVTTPTGSESDTITNYRSPNTTDDTFYKQTKTEQGKSFTNRKTEVEQTGTMNNDVTTTFNNHTHTANGTFTEKGYRGRDMVNTLTRMFNRPGMEWLNKVLDDIIYDILIICRSI